MASWQIILCISWKVFGTDKKKREDIRLYYFGEVMECYDFSVFMGIIVT